MTLQETMAELKRMGTPQNVKIYKKHGAGDNLFGVSFANLGLLKKKIKSDHALARQLWDTGNIDARLLATMVADPRVMTAAEADAWMAETTYRHLADYIAALVAKTSFAVKTMESWTKSKGEFQRQAGYAMLASMLKDGVDVPATTLTRLLKAIEKEIHSSPNWARYAMNNAVIAIGCFRVDAAEAALATARVVGEVDVDHGDTSCKTPLATAYIEKVVARNMSRARKPAKAR